MRPCKEFIRLAGFKDLHQAHNLQHKTSDTFLINLVHSITRWGTTAHALQLSIGAVISEAHVGEISSSVRIRLQGIIRPSFYGGSNTFGA